jgi:choline dehydrogenase-like flavoprotein
MNRSNDLQFHFACLIPPVELRQKWGIGNWLTDSHAHNASPSHGITFFPSLIQPVSRGTIRLSSSNPFDPPVIHPGDCPSCFPPLIPTPSSHILVCVIGYLSDEKGTDVAVLVRGLQIARQLTGQDVWKDTLGEELVDQELAKKHPPNTIEYLQGIHINYIHSLHTVDVGGRQ